MHPRIYGWPMNWSEYARRLVGDRQQVEVALLSGVSQGTVSRWLRGKGQPDVMGAIDFARACGGNPIEALVVLGVIRTDELDQVVEVGASGEDLTNGQLVELIASRLGVRITARGVRGA